ncbi:MAG: cyclic nucleotide-binding domain-containing protein [bacterium]|nr:cyclic nucleotide-binding domain-containing protein [bacterium]
MIDLYKKHPFLHDLEDTYVYKIISISSIVTINKGELFIRNGEYAEYFYLLINGLVEVKYEDISIQIIESGDIVGWSFLVYPYKWNFDVITLKDSILIQIDADKFKELMNNDKILEGIIYKKFFTVVANRLKSTRLKMIEIIKNKNNK